MRGLGRVFANAIARRVAYVIVALVLAALGVGTARAQSSGVCAAGFVTPLPGDTAPHDGAMEAFAHCNSQGMAMSPTRIGQRDWVLFDRCVKINANTYQGIAKRYGNITGTCVADGAEVAFGNLHTFTPKDCSRAPLRDGPARAPAGSLDCRGECEYAYHPDSTDPTKFYTIGTPTGRQCDYQDYSCPSGYVRGGQLQSGPLSSEQQSGNCIPQPPDTCPEGQSKQNGECKPYETCPAGKVMNPEGICVSEGNSCPAGKTKGPDGSCIDGSCPAGQVKGGDGSCKKDSDGDGNPDEDDGTFSGGDDCQTPPQCSGDAILCGQARIQWRIDCNTRKNRNISGGACNAVPICTGEKCDALEYSNLLANWRTSCAMEKLAGTVKDGKVSVGDGGGSGNNDGTVSGGACDTNYTCTGGNPMLCAALKEQNRMRCEMDRQRSELRSSAADGDGDDGEGSLFADDTDTPVLNEGLISFGSSIPSVSFDVGGQTFAPFAGDGFADLITWIRYLIIAAAVLTAINIIRGQ